MSRLLPKRLCGVLLVHPVVELLEDVLVLLLAGFRGEAERARFPKAEKLKR